MLTMRPPFTWISVAHPTEQNGQMLGTDFASLMRSSCAWARAGARVAPRPTSPPIAVPAPAPAVTRRKSRRLTCIRPLEIVSCAEQDLIARQDIPAAELDLVMQPLEPHRVRARRLETDHRGERPTAVAAQRGHDRRVAGLGDQCCVGQLCRIGPVGAVEAPHAPLGAQGITGLEPRAPSLEV